MNNGEQFFNTAAGGYAIQRSLRFNAPDSSFLSRTPASAGNRKTWTWAGWVKRSKLGARYGLFAAGSDGCEFFFEQSAGADKLHFYYYNNSASAYQGQCITTGLFRDPSAWYHVVLAVDTTQGTASNRCKIYVNGVEQATSFTTNFSSSADLDVNNTVSHKIGGSNSGGGAFSFDGLLADIHFIDGQALDPTSFGAFSATTGVWMPKAYTGSYGTNGFHLDFADNSTAAALGTDTSGNGNTWTVNNLSVTAGAGNDSLVDVPVNGSQTDTGLGGEVRGNYCTLNPLTSGSYNTLSNGNLDLVGNTNVNNGNTRGNFAFTTGKWYVEMTVTTVNNNYPSLGLIKTSDATTPDDGGTNQVGYPSGSIAYEGNGNKRIANSVSSYGSVFQSGDVIGVAIDADNGAVYFSRNGTWQNSGVPTSGSSKTGAAFTWTGGSTEYIFATAQFNGSASSYNFGQRSWAYQAPSGFKALNTANLPAPVITKPSTVMDIVLRTGTGTSGGAISSLNFAPDLIWTKLRSTTSDHYLIDTVRGLPYSVSSNNTNAEYNYPTWYTSTTPTGYTVGNYDWNAGTSVVDWCWDAGSSTVTDNTGSIQSTRRTNTSAGFSIVTYTGNGSNATVGHGLGAAPSMAIVKVRNRSGENWLVYHKSLATPSTDYLLLSSTAASGTLSGYWNGGPTSSVLGLGNYSAINNNGDAYVAYCFAPVAGYSSAFSYSGNGSSDGPMCYLGFRPRLILLKRTDSTGDWLMVDTSRSPYNLATTYLYANASFSEMTYNLFDVLSNGFKLRDNFASWNASGGTYVGFAWAESPFQYARAR
jgi:hypothetical protein